MASRGACCPLPNRLTERASTTYSAGFLCELFHGCEFSGSGTPDRHDASRTPDRIELMHGSLLHSRSLRGRAKRSRFKAKLNVGLRESQIGEVADFDAVRFRH